MLNEMEHDCRIRLKDTNYKEYSNYSILGEESYEACAKIYIQYCEYKPVSYTHLTLPTIYSV